MSGFEALQQVKDDMMRPIYEKRRHLGCEFCGTTFAHKEGMLCHIRSVHEGIRYQCDFCAKSFTQKPHLKSHLREAHNQ